MTDETMTELEKVMSDKINNVLKELLFNEIPENMHATVVISLINGKLYSAGCKIENDKPVEQFTNLAGVLFESHKRCIRDTLTQ